MAKNENAPIEVTSTSHWNTTLRGAKEMGHTIVVDFHAEWCGPCKQIAPYYTQLASQYPQCIFLRVDVDAQKAIAAKYKISAMPTFIIINSGIQVDGAMVRGADPQGLSRMVKQHAGPNPPLSGKERDAEAARLAGNKAFGDEAYELAITEYSKGLAIQPLNVQLLGNRSFAYLRLYQRDNKVKDVMQAMEDAKLATETEGEWAKGWVRAGEVFVAQSEDVRVYKDEEGLRRVLLAAESAWMAAVGYGEGKVRRESKEKLEALRERMISLGVPPATGNPEDFLR